MNVHPILGQVALGYSPMIDRQRKIIATRLTVFADQPGVPLDAGALLEAIAEIWPDGSGHVSLNLASESLLRDLIGMLPASHLMIEVPAFMAGAPALLGVLQAVHANGNKLLIKGRPVTPLPLEVLQCFSHSIIGLDEERRFDATCAVGIERAISHVQSGVRTLAEMEASFARGAVAVLGWPIDDAVVATSAKGGSKPELQTIVNLIHGVEREEPIERLEDVLKLDPALAFRLMRYINSPTFGLRVEVSSFRHAIMLLGYQKLKRWLALLLASASKEPNMRPVIFASVRRGMLMEELGRGGGDDTFRSEMFICGVFSLLDRMLNQPFAELLKTVPVPEGVYQALADGEGPYIPYFEMVKAIEQESLFDIRECADRLMMGLGEVNRALLRALAGASQLD